MAQLNNFVATNISKSLQQTRDFEGSDGWVALTNDFLGKIERLRMYNLGKRKEIGVEVFDKYWINVPSDLRKVISIYRPRKDDTSMLPIKREGGFINGRIKLHESIDNDEDAPTENDYSFINGASLSISMTTIDDHAEDAWKNYLLVTEDYNGIIIKSNTATSGGVTVLSYLHEQLTFPTFASGYLTSEYVMLQYQSNYTRLVNYDDEIPIDDRYEILLKRWLWYNALSIKDKTRPIVKKEFEEDLEETENEQFTGAWCVGFSVCGTRE